MKTKCTLDKLLKEFCLNCANGDEYHCAKLKSDGYCKLYIYKQAIEDVRKEIHKINLYSLDTCPNCHKETKCIERVEVEDMLVHIAGEEKQ